MVKNGPKWSRIFIWISEVFFGIPCTSSYTQCYTHQYTWYSCIWILSCSPTWYQQLDIPKWCDTWYCGSSVSGIDSTINTALFNIDNIINTVEHWQHFQQSFHRPCFAILGTAVPDTFYIPPMIEPPRNRINILCRIQTTNQTCELDFIIAERAPNNIILLVSVPKCEKSLLNIYERPFFGKFLFAVSGEYILKQWWLLGSWEQWQSTKCCSEA